MLSRMSTTPSRCIQPSTNGTAVVFVHGVLSDGDVCWESETAYWPDLLKAAPAHAGTGIYVFSYKTSITSGNYSISDAVDALAEELRIEKLLDASQLTFVCHSMGGLVVRQFLVTRQLTLVQRGIRIGLFLVASPSLGSEYANLLSAVVAVMGHSQGEALRFADDNIWLNDLDKNFKRLLDAGQPPVVGKELIEDVFVVKAAWLKSAVVRPFSGARYFGDPAKIADSTHTSIAKPESAEAVQHKLLLQFLDDCRAKAAAAALLPAAGTRIRIGRVVDGTVEDWRAFSTVHVTIGRGPENDVVVNDPKVSWEHGVVAVEMGVFVYRHLSRSNASTIRSRGREVRLTADGLTVLVDCGRGVLMRLTAAGVLPPMLDGLLITHLHSDHITDLSDVITTRWVMSPIARPLTIWGPPGTQEVVDGTLPQLAARANLLTAGRPVWRDSLTNVSLSGKGVRTLFIAGKIDNVAPSESVYKFFAKTIGDETKNSPDVRFLQPGRMNRHARDYDHSMMIASEELAAEILPDILKWLDL